MGPAARQIGEVLLQDPKLTRDMQYGKATQLPSITPHHLCKNTYYPRLQTISADPDGPAESLEIPDAFAGADGEQFTVEVTPDGQSTDTDDYRITCADVDTGDSFSCGYRTQRPVKGETNPFHCRLVSWKIAFPPPPTSSSIHPGSEDNAVLYAAAVSSSTFYHIFNKFERVLQETGSMFSAMNIVRQEYRSIRVARVNT